MSQIADIEAPIHVLLIEPHPIAANHILQILSDTSRFVVTVCAWFPSNEDACGAPPSVTVLDGYERSSAGWVSLLKRQFPSTKTLVIGEMPQTDEVARVVLNGAFGFVEYKALGSDLVLLQSGE